MRPEHPDWPGQQPPLGSAQAGLAEAPPAAAAASAPGAPALVVRTRTSEHTLRGGTIYRIGRDPKADIVVEDSRVSWQHGVLRLDGTTWVLEDAGSTNGTFVGPQRIDRFAVAVDCVVHLGNPDDGPVLRCMPQPAPVAPAPPVSPRRSASQSRPASPSPRSAPVASRAVGRGRRKPGHPR